MVNFIFRKLSILNQFFYFYFLNMDISLDIQVPGMKICTGSHKILVYGSVSQNFDPGLSFYFMSKNGKLFVNL